MNKNELNINNLDDEYSVSVEYDLDAFNDGVKSMSTFCGKVASLINLGVSPDEAVKYFSHRNELSVSKQITEIESNCRIECSKNANLMSLEENM